MTHGSLSTAEKTVHWSRSRTFQMHLAPLAVGVLAGVVAAQVKTNWGLPGHKALFWMIPVLAARLVCGSRLGTTFGAAGATGASLLLGGKLAGGPAMAYLVVLAGGVLDATVAWAERLRLRAWLLVPLLGLAGAAANLLCMVKRFASPIHDYRVLFGLTGLAAAMVSYALFGLAGGLGGGLIGCLGRRRPEGQAEKKTTTEAQRSQRQR